MTLAPTQRAAISGAPCPKNPEMCQRKFGGWLPALGCPYSPNRAAETLGAPTDIAQNQRKSHPCLLVHPGALC